MRAKTILAIGAACLSAAVGLAQSQKSMEAAKEQKERTPIFKSAADMTWTQLGMCGCHIAGGAVPRTPRSGSAAFSKTLR